MSEMCSCRRLYESGLVPDWIRQEIQKYKSAVPMTLPWWLSGDAPEAWRETSCGYYEVSTYGNVRRAKPGISTFVGRPVQPVSGPTGYTMVQLQSPHGKRRVLVHRLVAEVFLGPCPDGHVVNHKDADRQNNRLDNLEYVTYAENSQHAIRTVKRRKGPTKPKEPLKGPQVGTRWTYVEEQ